MRIVGEIEQVGLLTEPGRLTLEFDPRQPAFGDITHGANDEPIVL